MAKGRKAKPNKIIQLMGGTAHTHQPPRSDKLEPPSKIPTCPKHLDAEAKKEWKRASKILQSIDLLTELDMSILAAYCDAYSRWIKSTVKVQEMGMVYIDGRKVDAQGVVVKPGIPRLNPYIRIAKEAYEQMIKAGTLIGMSPSSRAGLGKLISTDTEKKDPYEEFLNQKQEN